MKRSAFTLVELIFTIVIIGVLAAVAVPKFKDLKKNAEVNAVVKTVTDTASSAASAGVNALDISDANASDLNLSDLVDVKGKGWTYTKIQGGGRYDFNNTKGARIAYVDFNGTARKVTYDINCSNFIDPQSVAKCTTDLNVTEFTSTLTF
jgi:prepilin-type N-terminal cleavage/methylation domain-containing protein